MIPLIPPAPPAPPTPAGPGPLARVVRTTAQTVVAVSLAIPAALAFLPDGPATPKVWAAGIAGALVVIVSAAQNALEHKATTKGPPQ